MQKELGEPPPASSKAVSKSMRSNRGKDTSPEMTLRSSLYKGGIRGYRLHTKGVPGRPDILFPRQRLAVFVNGCFWHRCPKCALPLPKSHSDFWSKKFELNRQRDERKIHELKSAGWRVLIIWECEIRKDLGNSVKRVKRAL
jgi:DNA mismatch endonuclease (patch repair protein)